MRGMTDVSGLREIRSLRSTGKRSIPRVQSSAHLDLYLLEKERERLEKEAAVLEKRRWAIRKRLADIQRQTATLEASGSRAEGRTAEERRGGAPHGRGKQWKTCPVSY